MKYSILTINYNNLAGLKRTADSVRNQTFNDYEWLVIDGGSNDGAKEYLESLSPQPDFWCCEKDNGVYDAMNKGIQKTHGEYIIFMNSGDVFHDNEVLAHVADQQPTADIVYGDWTQLFPDGHTVGIKAPKTFSLHFICTDNICHQAMFIKGEVMKQSPYDLRYQVYADWAKWIELTLKKATFQYVPYNICNFLMGGICCVSDKQDEERQMLKDMEMSPAILETLQTLRNQEEQLSGQTVRIAHLQSDLEKDLQQIDTLLTDIQSLRQASDELDKANHALHAANIKLLSELQHKQSLEQAYMSYGIFKIIYKLVRAYRKHIKKEILY